MLKRLHIRLNEQGLIDLDTWMIDSTAVRATRASSAAGKKGGLKNRKIMRSDVLKSINCRTAKKLTSLVMQVTPAWTSGLSIRAAK